MSSPVPGEIQLPPGEQEQEQDDPMQGSGQEDEEGEGDVVMPGMSDDSSEEGEDDEEEARKIREGFIVDEDDDEAEEDDQKHHKRRKRRKRQHRNREEEEDALDEDDFDLMAENTGTSIKRHRLTRLRRGRDSDSPPAASSSKRRTLVESSDDDLDNDGLSNVNDIHRIWDDDRGRDDDDEEGDTDDFIDSDDGEEGGHVMDEAAREERRREKKQELERRKKARRARPELAGIDAVVWDELHDVFGDGHDYDWALAGDAELEYEEEHMKPDMKYQDVFEPSEIRKRLLTDDDDLIRAQDVPERMQLATSSLSQSSTLSFHSPLLEADLNGASMWVTQRLSPKKTRDFFSPDGPHQHLKGALVMAVTFTLKYLFIEEFEVPYIWTHKRDYICHFDPNDIRSRFELLTHEELWRIYTLGRKYRSLLERRRALNASYDRLAVKDDYYEDEIQPQIDSVEVVADATEWLSMKYKEKKNNDSSFQFHDDEDVETKKRKTPSRISAYEVAKKSIVYKLAQGFGIAPHQVVLNFRASHHLHFVDDQELNPVVYAEQFADPDPSKAQLPEELLRRARMIISTELGKDPLLRNEMRRLFKEEARISVEPTERGITKIDDHHLYFNFKYLHRKPINDMLESAQFLHILAAEAEHLVTVTVSLPPQAKEMFERRLNDAFASDSFSDAARAWNEERSLVVQEVLDQHLIPAGIKWTREYIREEVEDYLAASCANQLRSRINASPYRTPELGPGETTSVLAVSWGKGDPHKDAITLVFVDEAGRMREHTKIDNLTDMELQDEFVDLLKRRKPHVIVIGGFSMATLKLSQRVKLILRKGPHAVEPGQELGPAPAGLGGPNGPNGFDGAPDMSNDVQDRMFPIPVIYIHDDVARIYQHSKRAADEFSALSPTAKYCVGLARYTQSPLNEYAALGSDITAISFEEEDQHLVPTEKLLFAFERALVDITNQVGVDINRAVADHYYQHLLPFVCGLGPRKAQVLVKKIGSLGGNLVNRDQFIRGGLLTTKIFLNAAGFLRISQEHDIKPSKNRHDDDSAPDPLDDTRIHPEDYELARKMATDALELDEEDVHDEHPSHVVSLIMHDSDNERKLSELNLDEFAISLYEANNDQKRFTLNVIRDELLRPFTEQRKPFPTPLPWDVVTMLSGETERTLRIGFIVSVLVLRPTPKFVSVRLDSGVEGYVLADYLADERPNRLGDLVKKGQTLQGVVVSLNFNLEQDVFLVELSTRRADISDGDNVYRREVLARKKRAEVDRTRRVIKHPNFHNFNTAQAEAYLEKQQLGDVVIRPSSKGIDHLAVTWKVDDKLYQHIDVTEPNADPTGQTIGSQLRVDVNHSYADLDELIVNHVQAMARRVEELMAHEKFKHGGEDELHLFLKNFLAANPAKSMYGFTLNRKRPGHFSLCFLANKNSSVQTWPVRVTPEAYYLFEAAAVGVPELCDAFKVRHLHESQNIASTAGGKTPFGAGMRTPARPGGATPGGHMSIRQGARTPNPYGDRTPAYNSGPPNNYGAPQTSYGYQTPSHRPPAFPPQPPTVPPGMNPERAAMLQQNAASSGGWGTNSGW
ncbi:SH2 domain-containing protein [Infundibulicybe gibba]|nr:SH2 domain-containing protein [Infundibulicybe gibba]